MSWHVVGHASELAREGDYLTLPWSAIDEVAVTNIAGELVAFDNRCPHRGARIFTDTRGNRPPVCGYHGRCARPEQMRQRFPVAVYGGFLLVSDDEGHAPPLPEALDAFLTGIPALTLHSTFELEMDCHWTVAIENALDSEHVAHVHSGSLARLLNRPFALETMPDGSSIEHFGTNDGERFRRLGEVFPKQRFGYAHAHVFPISCIATTRGWTYSLQNYLPRDDGRTTLLHRLYVTETTRPMDDFFADVARMNRQVFEEDAAICRHVPAGDEGPLGPLELRIAHFRRNLL